MSIIRRDASGNLVYTNHNSHLRKNKPDTPLDNAVVPYIIMVFCAIVDATVFLNLFKLISYDSPFMLGVQVSGFLFGFDVVPIYIGIYLKRLKQGLVKDKTILWCALAAFGISLIMNIFLRISTINELSPAVTTLDVNTSNSVGSTAIALTVFGIGLPFITSLGSFFVSYLTYNPLKIRKDILEEDISNKKEDIRQIEATINEYILNPNFAEDLINDDNAKFEEMKKLHKAIVLEYCDYVRVRLMEHLANPVALNALSEESCEAILERLNRELSVLYSDDTDSSNKTLSPNDITPINPIKKVEGGTV